MADFRTTTPGITRREFVASPFAECFGAPRALIGMLHLGALPGTPSASQSIDSLIQQALTEAQIYRDEGVTALAIENMHDRPYLKGGVGPEITAAMTADNSRAAKIPGKKV